MKTDEIRSAFLDYFSKRHGHTVVASSSLVPAGDPTLLFTNAGMVQFKDCFLGTDKRSYTRAATSQKCLRISGKHNDLENVGRTARHHTFFEMLGNFSFGDYFKKEAIEFAWEFLTQTLALPKDRLWVTVFKDDDEAAALWAKHTDVLPGRILRFGEKDNFWAMGDTGPCGPCSEIFYYLGSNVSGQSEDEFRSTDGLYVEVWNLVFMQFNRDPGGALTPLPKPSVDTGMGLERIAAVKQGVLANYDTDLLREIITFTEKLSGKRYDGRDYSARSVEGDEQYGVDVALRVIADHVRAASFLVADGVSPSSDGRGYVLRRLIRRACRHGRVLGFRDAFLFDVAGCFVRLMGKTYPELTQSAEKISKLIKAEEQKFLETLDTGLQLLEKETQRLSSGEQKFLTGRTAFLLHDTYGFPLDMTEDILQAKGISVDVAGFEAAMEEQRERSRASREKSTELILQRSVKPRPGKFVGYDFLEYESCVSGIFTESAEVQHALVGDQVAVVVAETPFYAESGGQVGDTGTLSTNNSTLEVLDTQKAPGDTIVHICRVVDGELRVGEQVRLSVSAGRRKKLRANHSATHLLHLALRETLGDHVKQAGSRVGEQSLRFDFSHFEPISSEKLLEIEFLVNEQIRANHVVQTQVLPIEEAKKSGAVALFGEKYGSTVRVVQMGERSREFCGGTHVERSGDIGYFSLLSEGGVAAGVRRIEAVGGAGAVENVSRQKQLLKELGVLLRAGERELLEKVERLLEEQHELQGKLERMMRAANLERGGDLVQRAVMRKDGVKVLASIVPDATPQQLREMADDLRNRLGTGVIALGSVQNGKAILLTAVTQDLVGRYHAGELLQQISVVAGGKGGGRPDLAQAGGADPERIEMALNKFQDIIS